jgi:hypothetical protein
MRITPLFEPHWEQSISTARDGHHTSGAVFVGIAMKRPWASSVIEETIRYRAWEALILDTPIRMGK